jgi:hypothetical protein
MITDCGKTDELPLGICAEDDARETIGLQEIGNPDIGGAAEGALPSFRLMWWGSRGH